MNLSYFSQKDFYKALKQFFNDLNIPINPVTEAPDSADSILSDTYNANNPAHKLMEDVYFVGMVSEDAFTKQREIKYATAAKDIKTKDYDCMLLFGVTLKTGRTPSRSQLAEITRAFNRQFSYYPVVVIFKYGESIAFANCERLAYKQAWRVGEKVGKVSLLKDIAFNAPHTGHLKILLSLEIARSGSKAITTFSGLYKYWQEVFNVSILTNEFFREVSNWYFWAKDQVNFPPGQDRSEKKVVQATCVIRLITRLIFVWFLKEKKVNGHSLIPSALFDKDALSRLLIGFAPEIDNQGDKKQKTHSIYYRAILQNLFFATLNQPMNNRRWRKDGIDEDKNVYRHQNLFKAPEQALDQFKDIPFLNGGLFECLEQDQFSDLPDVALLVPDAIFFSPDIEIDLNDEYGTKNKKYSVSGIVNILSRYIFTVEENTPLEEQIALDPELLGKVFENLLASYNPETGATARKQTGSFYTPREIVNYMVDESLKTYLQQKLEDANIENMDECLNGLFSYVDDENPFGEEDTELLIDALHHLKVLDPACGSGAFPMGILHKMTHILAKLDPGNVLWKERQLRSVEDSAVREHIERTFDANDMDYGRKLYLVQNCIYGVDIQPIAVQITKLRFFISLIVDQRVHKDQENLGILPLPNMETKFVAANSLIGLEKPVQLTLRDPAIEKKEKELKNIRDKHFTASNQIAKQKCFLEDERLRNEISDLLKKDHWPSTTANKIAAWNPYDTTKSSGFFDTEWMFGMTDGFDICIGNPPYVGEKGHKEIFQPIAKSPLGERFYLGKMDLFYFFFHLGLDVLHQGGVLAFITTNYFITATGARKLRDDFRNRSTILEFINFNELKIFESALGQHNMVTVLQKGNLMYEASTASTKRQGYADSELLRSITGRIDSETLYSKTPQDQLFKGGNIQLTGGSVDIVLDKMQYNAKMLGKIVEVNSGADITLSEITKKHADTFSGNFKMGDGCFVISEDEIQNMHLKDNETQHIKDFIKSSNITKYGCVLSNRKLIYFRWDDSIQSKENIEKHLLKFKSILDDQIMRFGESYPWFALHRPRKQEIFESPEKILVPYRAKENIFGFSIEPLYSSRDVFFITQPKEGYTLKFLLGILNSRLIFKWLYNRGKRKGEMLELYQEPLSAIPIPLITDRNKSLKQKIEDLVNQILTLKKQSKDANTKSLEANINQLVYKLYDLTDEEIDMVEGK